MDLAQLLDALSRPDAYPFPVGAVELRQTHISAVFLAGDGVYKVKKPAALGFLDFSTLDKRHRACLEEVRLNRRLAPSVYLGVVPIVVTPDGVRVEGAGAAVEWAVKMRRLPDEVTFLARLRRGELEPTHLEALARRLAAFHRRAEASQGMARFADAGAIARNVREVVEKAGRCLDEKEGGELARLAEGALQALGPLIDARADRGMTRDCHGDLHLDHVYYFPEQLPPDDLVILDCIEFNERFRYLDPVADMAFVWMDLAYEGRWDLARAFADAYFEAAGDEEGRPLLPLYAAYRAAVRAMVEGQLTREGEVPEGQRTAAKEQARAHALLALQLLAA